MVLNTHTTPYDDDDLISDEEEWEFLSGDVASPPIAAATPADITATIASLETSGDKYYVQSADANSIKEQYVAETQIENRSVENRQDESESNISASTAERSNGALSSAAIAEAEQTDINSNNHLNDNDVEMEEETESAASGTNNEDEGDSTPPPQQQPRTQNNTNDPLQNTWNFIENTFQGIDKQHQLRHRTRNSVEHINRSMQNLFSNVTDETLRVRDQVDVHAQNASTHVRHAASSAKESICRANAEYKLSEKLATAAVIGGATLLALGNPRAGVTALALAGASLAVGEIISSSNYEESSNRNREEYGLREGVHLD